LAHMSISTYFRPNIHQNGPEILGVNFRIIFCQICPKATVMLKYAGCGETDTSLTMALTRDSSSSPSSSMQVDVQVGEVSIRNE
jgi:hypothetical protein